MRVKIQNIMIFFLLWIVFFKSSLETFSDLKTIEKVSGDFCPLSVLTVLPLHLLHLDV